MKRLMVRLDDDLHTRVFNAAHDNRTSLNAYVVSVLEEKVGDKVND